MREDLRTNPDALIDAPAPRVEHVQVHGTRLYAEVRGRGPTILIIPGGAEDAEGWRPVAERVPNRLVVTYDRRGTLRSGREDWPGQGSAQHADDAAGLMRRLGLDDAVVFGGSSAGIIAVQIAIRHPALVRRALVYEPGYLRAAQGADDVRSPALAAIEARLRTHPGDWVGAYRAFARAAAASAGPLTPPAGREWYAQREELNAEAIVRDDIPILTAELVDEAALVATPVDMRFAYGSDSGSVYTTTAFDPTLTFTLGDGWYALFRDDVDEVAFEDAGTFLGITRPAGVIDTPPRGAVPTPVDVATWLSEHPALVATAPTVVEIAGQEGVTFEVVLEPGPTQLDIFKYPTGNLHLLQGTRTRFWVVPMEGADLVILAVAPEAAFQEAADRVQAVVDSLLIAP